MLRTIDNPKWIKALFFTAGIYEAIIGVSFLIIPLKIFNFAGLLAPPHIAYIQFPASLLLIFSIMLFKIADNPKENQDLIIYVSLLKISYCSVVFSYMLIQHIPFFWVLFAYLDFAFLVLFFMAKRTLREA